ncbi:PQQ-dependent sugar dehydrogenase [Fundicoccus culcitae]|uniref:PQQ-dependent sugar dehydrogenase n=1 Tax=Fundicoccus culcitae TaxID=2969821 RepID=A0ABY5P6V1_9LACT|nr:PQQ-dependent sugar dehydrogenase [Fundicoccus culcitae]UUX34467.1 PQQ-dependent sugar dehydrogenase [Fundicoccus culcitae]
MKNKSKRVKSMVVLSFLGSQMIVTLVQAQEGVETKPPVTEYEPRFPEQTRAQAVETEAEYDVNVITEALNSPWGMDELPDGRLLITQKNDGNMLIYSFETGELGQPIVGFPEVNNGGQGGMLDVAIAPDFKESRLIYFTFSENVEDGTVTAVGRGLLSEDETQVENTEVIFRAEPAYNGNLHYGSRLVFDNEGNLYVSFGERSDAGIREEAQNVEAYLGTVIHITADGQAVEASPYINDAHALAEIFTYGHRNVQGMDMHPETGEVWISEMGPQGGDEVNRLEAGSNYGWPRVSYGIEYSGAPINEGETSGDSFTEPIYYWDPSIAPSGMAFYDSDVIAEWGNNLFIGALAGSHIARLVIEDNWVVGEERLLANEEQRFRDIHVGTDGAIYAITDQGRLYQIQSAE